MAWWLIVMANAFIRYICHSFRDGAKIRWRILPSHWKDQRECNKLFMILRWRDDDAQLRDIRRANVDPVETVRYVHLAHVDWTVSWVGVNYILDDAL
jgi:ribonuclease D